MADMTRFYFQAIISVILIKNIYLPRNFHIKCDIFSEMRGKMR